MGKSIINGKRISITLMVLVAMAAIAFAFFQFSNESSIIGYVSYGELYTLKDPVNELQIREFNNKVSYSEFEDEPATFTLDATVYYTSLYDDFNTWCSAKKGSCFSSNQEIVDYYGNTPKIDDCVFERKGNYCCIQESDRGFKEDVKCQGSGKQSDKIYKAGTIKDTQASSPFLLDFVRGKTAVGFDPQPKWTVAVNTKERTNCYIPYFSLMYIYFGNGNEWNGVYRAEDTGSAFLGKCKIDIYAGVGVDKKNAAVAAISGKKAKIYLLDKDMNYLQSNDRIQAGVLSQTGEIHAPYRQRYSIDDIGELYDLSKDFAKEVINKCSNLQVKTQKETCIDQQISQFEKKNLVVTQSCLDEGYPIDDENYLADHFQKKFPVKIGGNVVSKEPQGTLENSEDAKLILSQVPNNRVLVMKFVEDNTLIVDAWNKFQVGDYLELSYVDIVQMGNEMLVHVGDDKKSKEAQEKEIIVNPGYYTRDLLKNTATELADCTTSSQPECLCNVNTYGGINHISFLDHKIFYTDFTEGNYVDLTIDIFPQDTSITTTIEKSESTEFSLLISPSGKLAFKKNSANELIAIADQSLQPNLEACIPEKFHYLMCTNMKDSDDTPLRFTLKI